MISEEDIMAEYLVRIFENVLLTEEKSLSQGYFSDLSIAEMHTLTAIGPYEAKTMSNTAAELGITTGTLTVSIDRLVKKGYVIRKRDEKDKRVVRISLTRNGKLACRMHSKFHRVLAKRILDPYEADDRSKLIKLVEEIDTYIATQLRRYDESDSIRKTAKEVALESRRSVEKNG
ncbi:MAG: MarR family transcriptional regulator [Clostridiales bacterium]|nr:MarR family transcriptional regulator [Clostridiales bacterium]